MGGELSRSPAGGPAAAGADPVVLHRPSPNRGPRRGGLRPRLVVLHHTAMASAEAALERLCDPAAEVSAHYLIGRDGRIWQLVAEEERAWHAGAGHWAGAGDVNSRSIGIELDNPGPLAGLPPFAAAQMAALEALLAAVLARWEIPAEGVIAHSDMAPDRKADPGPAFDWRRLARAGLAVWPDVTPPPPRPLDAAGRAALAAALGRFGYPVAQHPLEVVLAAFRLRFRPRAEGPADAADLALAAALAARWPAAPVP